MTMLEKLQKEALEKLKNLNLPEEIKLQSEEAIKNLTFVLPFEKEGKNYLLIFLLDEWVIMEVKEVKTWEEVETEKG